MIGSVAAKAAWVGRTASMVFGLALVMALVVGAASTAWSATGGNFILGKGNAADAITKLAGAAGVDGPMLKLVNNNADPNDTALDLRVQAEEAPMRVNSDTKVANLNADKLDGLNSSQFFGTSTRTYNKVISLPGEEFSTQAATIPCEPGDKVLSGGFDGFSAADTVIVASYGTVDQQPESWRFVYRTGPQAENNLSISVLCADV